MATKILTILLFLNTSSLIAQNFLEVETPYFFGSRFVSAPSGLFLRKNPRRDSPSIALLRYGTQVRVLPQARAVNDTYGAWLQVETQSGKGWVFEEFVKEYVPTSKQIRHWNSLHTLYFIVTSQDREDECGALLSGSLCQVSVFDSKGTLLAKMDQPEVGVKGWRGTDLILLRYGGENGYYRYSLTAWSPSVDSDARSVWESEVFSLARSQPVYADDKRDYDTIELCIKARCYYTKDYPTNNKIFLYKGSEDRTAETNGQLIQSREYKETASLGTLDDRILLLIDDKTYEITDSGLEKVSLLPEFSKLPL